MPISMDGLPSVVDDDFIENQSTVTTLKRKIEVNDSQPQKVIILDENIELSQATECNENINSTENIIITDPDNVYDTKSPAALLRTPVSKPLRIRKMLQKSKASCRDLKAEVLKKTIEQGDNVYQLQIKHMEDKTEEEKALYEKKMELLEIKKKKLLLEISLLERK